jgi:hypothetical protein
MVKRKKKKKRSFFLPPNKRHNMRLILPPRARAVWNRSTTTYAKHNLVPKN